MGGFAEALFPLFAEGASWGLRVGLEKTLGVQVRPTVEDRTKVVIQKWLEGTSSMAPFTR